MNGILIVNKSEGITSQGVVSKVKKVFNIKKAGHTGTLDPLATGVLPILVGNATKLSKYLIEHDKTYRAVIKLGEKTSTGDREGEIIETKNIPEELNQDFIEKVLSNFLGKQVQIPPIYSAIKVNGKKLYEYAREGKEIEIPTREIEIYSISLMNFLRQEKTIEFEVTCSKGTYIRTLCEDIAKELGTVGYMQCLNRVRVDKFSIEESFTLEEIESGIYKLISMEELFKEYPQINLNARKLELFLNGVNLTFELEDGIYNVYSNHQYIGLGTVTGNLLKRDVIVSSKFTENSQKRFE